MCIWTFFPMSINSDVNRNWINTTLVCQRRLLKNVFFRFFINHWQWHFPAMLIHDRYIINWYVYVWNSICSGKCLKTCSSDSVSDGCTLSWESFVVPPSLQCKSVVWPRKTELKMKSFERRKVFFFCNHWHFMAKTWFMIDLLLCSTCFHY